MCAVCFKDVKKRTKLTKIIIHKEAIFDHKVKYNQLHRNKSSGDV